MKVVHDISVLGLGQYNALARTGVARVVENIVCSLAESQECDLLLSHSGAFDILQACLEYRSSNPRLKAIPLAHSSFIKSLYTKLIELDKMLNNHSQISHARGDVNQNESFVEEFRQSLVTNWSIINKYAGLIYGNSLDTADIFHANYYPIAPEISRINHLTKFMTIFDLIPILYPHFFGQTDPENNVVYQAINGLTNKEWVICISNHTKNDVCSYKKNIDPDKVFVTHLAADRNIFYPCFSPEKKLKVNQKYSIPNETHYFLSLSTLEKRKNIDHLIRCFAKLIAEEKLNKEVCLVLAGSKGWNYEKILEEISNRHVIQNRIIITGRIEEEDLASLYSGATAFIYPSFYEGFGLPALEAMQCGTPVITSNTSSLPEVVGDAGIMLDPTDEDGLSHSMLQIYKSSSLREAMSQKSIEQSKKFSWEKCANETLNAYKTALLHK